MSSRFFIPLLTAAGACALFSFGIMLGLGVLTAPPKIDANTPSKYAQRLQEKTDQATHVAERALTPIYPTDPAMSEKELRAAKQAEAAAKAKPAANKSEPRQQSETTGAPAVSESSNTVPAKTGSISASAAASKPEPVAETPAKHVANAVPVAASVQSPNHCDVQACASAYKSFRESDCTYQPYSGPRQLCVKPPTPEQRQASGPRDDKPRAVVPERRKDSERSKDANLRDVAEEVERMTRGSEDSDAVPAPAGRRVIVIDRW